MMHGASRNSEPVREGLVAMIAPSIDSGVVCTLTALAVLINAEYSVTNMQGMQLVMESFERSIPGLGSYLLMAVFLLFRLCSPIHITAPSAQIFFLEPIKHIIIITCFWPLWSWEP